MPWFIDTTLDDPAQRSHEVRSRASLCDPPCVELVDFALLHLGRAPVRVLEVGCGKGHLALSLAASGHQVLAIDPAAPEGAIFERVTLEEFSPSRGFDAVIAGYSLHHMADLDGALDKIAQLAPLLIVEEFAWDLLDEPTTRWYLEQLEETTTSVQECRQEWVEEHAGLHGHEALRAGLEGRFEERYFDRRPYFYRYPAVEADEASERALIDAGAITALGFRYVGVRRESAPGSGATDTP